MPGYHNAGMCGIAGFLVTGGVSPDRELLARMCTRLAHRGPDGYGYFTDARIALGHRRLSIIDVAGGAQPLGNEDGSIQIVFNGEIYNYRELRAELIARGHRFSTNSDTEVIVHLYEEKGERTPEYLNGMFAFAIWDTGRGELLLARDRFGKKPLYYTTGAGIEIAFASELKALVELPGFAGEVAPEAVADFLTFGYIPDPRTIYRGVEKLPPAYTLVVRGGEVRLRKYWELEFRPEAGAGYERKRKELRELARDAVERRLMSDVPLGAFLSGGLDSSTVVSLMAACAGEPAGERVRSFSVGFTSKPYDEVEYARLVAARYRTEHAEEIVTPQVHEVLDALVEHFDEPFGDPSAIPTLYLCRMTRRGVTVALSGDGGDEIFGGYKRYQHVAAAQAVRKRLPRWLRGGVARAAGLYPSPVGLPRWLRWKAPLTYAAGDLADAYFAAVSQFRGERLDAILAPELMKALKGYSPRDWFRSQFGGLGRLPALSQMQAVDVKTYLPGDILVKVDRASMACSLEVRAPLLDYRLAEFAAGLPAGFLSRGGRGKLILREAFAGELPAATSRRGKQGFAVPKALWFRTSLKSVFEEAVLQGRMGSYLSLNEVRRLWIEHQSGWKDHSTKLWFLLMLGHWDARHKRWGSPMRCQSPVPAVLS